MKCFNKLLVFVFRFIDLLGTVFGFTNKDINEKITILKAHNEGPAADKYKSIQSMVEYEVSNKITETKADLPNGCRTLLRLHRALDFLTGFLEILQDSDPKLHFTNSVHACYKNTLGRYHPWVVQKAVGLALYTLPTKETILQMIAEGEDAATIPQQLTEIIEKLRLIFNNVQRLYTVNNIMDLPWKLLTKPGHHIVRVILKGFK